MFRDTSSFRSLLARWALGLTAMVIIGAAGLFAADHWVMPAYTHYQEGVTVPDITKVSYEEATERLDNYGLRYEVLDRRSHAAYPANYIIDQAPVPGQVVKPNRKIYLTVNTTEAPTATVPDLTNMSLRNARIQLQNSNLQPGVVSYESSRFRNTVLRQSVPPGEIVAQGTTVDLAVSDGLGGEMVRVPELLGEQLPDAQRMIREAGLRIGDVRFQRLQGSQPNTVISITPEVSQLREGESIDLVIAERFDAQEESESGVILEESDELDPSNPTEEENRQETDPESAPASPQEMDTIEPLQR